MKSFVSFFKKFLKIILWMLKACFILFVLAVFAMGLYLSKKVPSNDREWNDDQKVLASARFSPDGKVFVKNIRNIEYRSASDYTVRYYDKEYDIEKLKKAWFVLEPFTGYIGAAHSFVSFEFEDGTFLSISAEIRKEKGEKFSALKGILREYEMMYVVADEKDVIKLRANFRKDKVFVYPGRTTDEKAKRLFREMLERANALAEKPEFYNTVTNNCTTNIAYHINRITPRRISLMDYRLLMPENVDRYAYDLGLLDTDLPFEEAREKHLINPFAETFADDPEYSLRIRGR